VMTKADGDSKVTAMEHLVDWLDEIEDGLLEHEMGCSHGCRSMLLGSLTHDMKICRLYPPPEPGCLSFRLSALLDPYVIHSRQGISPFLQFPILSYSHS
jgi:hypothetical protein